MEAPPAIDLQTPPKNRKVLIVLGIVLAVAFATVFVVILLRTGSQKDGTSESISRAVGVSAETADDTGWVGIDSNIAVDSQNLPHISYFDEGNGRLKYARKLADGSWQWEVIDDEGRCGEESGIVIDVDGNPHVSYLDAASGELRYATKVNGTWRIQVVDDPPPGLHTVGTSLKLDSQGYPHITYTFSSASSDEVEDTGPEDYPERGLRYAYWDGTNWQTEIIWPMADDPYLALDANDKAHIIFRSEEMSSQPGDNPPVKIIYATNVSGSWQLMDIDGQTKVGGDTALDLDSSGRPHVVYNDLGRGAVRYAYLDGGEWQTEEVAADRGVQEGVKIAVDNNDRPRIVYVNTRDERLHLAALVNGAWEDQVVDRMGVPCVVVDALNRSHLSYTQSYENHPDFDEEIEILRYALVE